MAKLTLTDLASLTNETSAITTINNNNAAIETALENTLSRDGTSPNSMGAQLDMNTHKIINLDKATEAGEALEYSQLQDKVDDITLVYNNTVTAKNQAVAAQTAAETAQTGAEAAEASAEDILADVQALFDTYNNQFLGTFTDDPTVDNDGNALTVGDIFYNSTTLSMRVWDGTNWQDIAAMTPTSTNVISNKTYEDAIFRNTFIPETDDGAAIGTVAKKFSDIFLAAGAVINFNNGNVALTHSDLLLTASGALTVNGSLTTNSDFTISSSNPFIKITDTDTGADNFFGGNFTTGSFGLWADYNNEVAGSEILFSIDSNSDGNVMRLAPTKLYSTTDDGVALGDTTHNWSDLFLASGAVINFNNSDVTITHATNQLNFAGAANGYRFDVAVAPATNGGSQLGSTGLQWNGLYLVDGVSVDFGNGTSYVSTNSPTGSIVISCDENNLTDGSHVAFRTDGVATASIFTTDMSPASNDTMSLGTTTTNWSDLFLASGAVINFNNGDVTLTHSSNTLTFAGASSYVFDVNITAPGALFNSSNAGIELGKGDASNTPFIDFHSSGNANDYDARILASGGTTAGTGILTVTASDFRVSSTGSQGTSVVTLNGGQTLLGGFSATSDGDGTISSSTYTPDPTTGNFKHITANGAFTFAPPSSVCTLIVEITNGASAGTITTSGFTKVTGDTYATTSTNKFLFFVTKTNSYSHLHIQSLQ